MSDDYLWDPRSAERAPDPELARLERVMSTLKHVEKSVTMGALPPNPRAPEPAQVIPITRARRWQRIVPLATLAVAGIAAALALVMRPPPERAPIARRASAIVRAAVIAATPPPPPPAPDAPAGPSFAVTRLAGAPRVGAGAIDATGKLGVGQWLETDASSRARVDVAEIGEVEVGEGSRVKLSATGPDQHRLDLERGAISAYVNAPPRLFVVGTPAATAVDLGCRYTLAVDADGAGTLRVKTGWVALEDGPRSSYVPAGASCRTRKGAGPGTPSYDDAPPALREALGRFDFEAGGEEAVREVLHLARRRDALTIWHLIPRVEEALRSDVVHKLAALSPPPRGAKEASAQRLDPAALEAWRKSLRVDLPITW